jgi:ketosteroid isomerase-like protein
MLRSLKKFDEAEDNGDAATLAAYYAEDAVLLENTGPIYGREAIELGGFDRRFGERDLIKTDQFYFHPLPASCLWLDP